MDSLPHADVDARQAAVSPDSVEGDLLRSRLMSGLFGRDEPSPRFGRFELCDLVGRGGMGTVYEAWDPQLERSVAIKVVDIRDASEEARQRAVREARSLARLSHPNVITVFESGLRRGRVWIAMELVSGSTLGEWRAEEDPSVAEIVRRWIAVGRGLQAAHEAGLVHRDVKPSNVLVDEEGRPRLIDFGLAHGSGGRSSSSESKDDDDAGSAASPGTPRFAGTYRYAAPEQREEGIANAAADQHSLCACICEALWGELQPPMVDDGGVPPRVQAALVRGLARTPEERFSTVGALVDELQAAIAPPGRRMGPWLAGVGLGALVLGGSLVWWQADTALVEPCVVDSQALQGTWDPERRAALRRTILSSSAGYAEPTWRALEEGLDTWADHWLQARRSACLATRVEGTQSEASLDLRMACLDRAARSLAITLDTVTASEEGASLPARAPALLERLPVLAACDDPRPLAQVEARPEGEAVEAIYEGISRARAQASMGQLDRARASVEALEQRWPLAARYAPVRIELAALPSQLDIEDGRREAAVQRLVELSREAQARHLDDLAAQLRVEAAGAAAGYLRSARLERFVVDEAAAALERLGRPSDRRWAAVRHAEANLALKSARLEEALEGFGRARELATEGGDHARAEQERWHIAATLARLGRLDEARALLVEGRDLAEQRWGEGAPLVGHFEFDLSVLEQEAGRFEEAAAHLQRAQTIYEAAFGVESFPVARTHYAEAKLRMVQGDLGGARARIDEALVVYLRELSPEHEGLVDLHEARGVLRFFQGDLEGSIADYEAALRIGAAVLPADDPTLGRLHSNRGESEAALGDIDAARRSFDRALEIYARGLPPDHVDWALPLKGRGQAALAQGRIEPAIVDLERGLQLQQRSGEEPLELADLRASLARAYLSRGGRSDDAMALAQRAREDFAAVGMDERVEELDQWLAEIARSRRSPASEP